MGRLPATVWLSNRCVAGRIDDVCPIGVLQPPRSASPPGRRIRRRLARRRASSSASRGGPPMISSRSILVSLLKHGALFLIYGMMGAVLAVIVGYTAYMVRGPALKP